MCTVERWSEKLLKISDRAIVEAAVAGFKAYLDIPDYARRSSALGGFDDVLSVTHGKLSSRTRKEIDYETCETVNCERVRLVLQVKAPGNGNCWWGL